MRAMLLIIIIMLGWGYYATRCETPPSITHITIHDFCPKCERRIPIEYEIGKPNIEDYEMVCPFCKTKVILFKKRDRELFYRWITEEEWDAHRTKGWEKWKEEQE